MTSEQTDKSAKAGLILGIASVFPASLAFVLGFAASITGFILSLMGLRKNSGSRKTAIFGMVASGVGFVLSIISTVVVLGMLASLTPALTANDIDRPQNETSQWRNQLSEDEETTDYAARFLERDQFINDQQLPLDGSPLKAITDEQKKFVAEHRAHVESSGGNWSDEAESLILALTADACESAILNGHKIDAFLFMTHVASSPLFNSLAPDTSEDYETVRASIADIMVYGMQHLCPADFDDWTRVFYEVYPNY